MPTDQPENLPPFIQRIAYLVSRHQQGLLTATEQEELQAWIAASPENQRFFAEQTDAGTLAGKLQQFEKFDTAAAWNTFQASHFPAAAPARVRTLYPSRWTAAAAVILLVGAALYFRRDTPAPPPLAALPASPVVPGHSQALLTLADGSVVALDSNGHRAITQPGATAQQQNGQLAYTTQGNAPVTMNTLSTPRGGQFRLILPDGTQVWLNAASSITYPTAFTGDRRSVSVKGEAYFEVASRAAQPFTVTINPTTTIDVLGTSFNVNAYTDEPAVSTTLVQGAIKVNAGTTSRILQPGQQAKTSEAGLQVKDHADTTAILAWKREVFYFQDADIPSVMRQLSRWYDVTVTYAGAVPSRRFQGEIQRNLPLADVLEGLESTGIRFRLQGHHIIVTP